MLQRPQLFRVDGPVRRFCVLVERFSDTGFQMVDAEPGGGRDGDDVSERELVLRCHVLGQQTGELCRTGRKVLGHV